MAIPTQIMREMPCIDDCPAGPLSMLTHAKVYTLHTGFSVSCKILTRHVHAAVSREHLEVIKPHRERFGPDGGGKRVGLCRKQQRMRSELPLVCS